MKKFFALAFAAVSMAFASCSNETTEDLEAPSEVTRASIDRDSETGHFTCSLHGDDCQMAIDLNNGDEDLLDIIRDWGFDHCHCTKEDCFYYLNYKLTNVPFYDEDGNITIWAWQWKYTGYEWMEKHAREANGDQGAHGGHGAIK